MTSPASSRSSGPGRLDPDQLAALEEQRDFLLRSLADLEREREVGDLDEVDYRVLRDDYTARAAETLRAIEAQRDAFAEARRPRSRGRTLAVAVGVLAFAVVAGVLVASSLGSRQAGESASGGVTAKQSPSQRAQACIQKLAPNAPSEAITCFQEVLDDDPRNPVALAWLGWQLELSSGLVGDEEQTAALQQSATDLVERAVEVDPGYSYARAFRAVLAYRHGHYEDARRYLEEFRANDPSPDAEAVISSQDLEAKIEEALAGEATPSTIPAGPAASTTTSAPG